MSVEWANLDVAFDALEAEVGRIAKGVTVSLWKDILKRTPQYTGEMAASWTYSIGTPVYVDRGDKVESVERVTRIGADGEEFDGFSSYGLWRGHQKAIGVANKYSAGKEDAYKLGDVVYIANGAGHAGRIELDLVQLRGVNLPGRPAHYAISSIASRYSSGISRRAAAQLKRLRIE